ncbi:hypothetical protein [Saccharospirillum salsuginis]|uniref:Uncharacterized protein n=1 Tax=Saccharospirillum salsuginis TaxID=418750 RepID=A0A918KV30_9GAMM|nr:hypothetical protein [Saccharospirillum salsuginis]GGX75444.1 hypothetical protein GCM10007392_48250 [Saccharospirillum salsuginis]
MGDIQSTDKEDKTMFGGAIGGMFSGGIGSIVGGMFGGPIGAMAGSLLQNIGSQVIDQAIENSPLPQPLKDAMQASFHAGLGNFQEAGKNIEEMMDGLQEMMNPLDFNQLQGGVDDLQSAMNDLINYVSTSEEGGNDAEGWLRAIAGNLGEKLDAKAGELEEMSENLNSDNPSEVTDYTAATKEFSMLFEGVNTALKTIGDALTSAARKQ